MVPGKIVPEKNGPRKIGPRKNGPRETQKQKIVGWASTIVVCVCVCVECSGVTNLWKAKTRKQTQNSESKNRGVSVEHRGVCVECSDVINLWKPKTSQETFLDSFRVL